MGCHALLQGIFLTQGKNQCLLGALHQQVGSLPLALPGKSLFLCQFSSVQLLSRVLLFVTPCTAALQASLSISNSRGLLKLMSIESVMPSHSLSSHCPPAFSPSQHEDFFQMSQLFISGGQSIGASASESVLPMNIQD